MNMMFVYVQNEMSLNHNYISDIRTLLYQFSKQYEHDIMNIYYEYVCYETSLNRNYISDIRTPLEQHSKQYEHDVSIHIE